VVGFIIAVNQELHQATDILMTKADSTPTLASSIAAMLRERIAHGELAPGAKLRLHELRTMSGVSLSPLRQALTLPSAEGFVATEDQRGYRVVPVSQNNLDEVIRLRVQFESYALREAIIKGDDVWEGEVLAALHRLNKIERGRVDVQGVSQWEQFHSVFHR